MDIYKKLEREKNSGILKVLISVIFAALSGYFVYTLTDSGFFIGWENYFAVGCYILILLVLTAVIIGIIRWIGYQMYIDDGKLRIRYSRFSREISIPLERIYYIDSTRSSRATDYDTIFITDKKTGHKKVRKLNEDELRDNKEHLKAVMYLKEMYPDRTFYYYRLYHHGYKFSYFLYMIYKNCEKCKLSDISMGLVKEFVETK
jgi:hypothetical protein